MDNPLDTERLEGRKFRVVVAEVINPLKLSKCIHLAFSENFGRFQTISLSRIQFGLGLNSRPRSGFSQTGLIEI